MNGSQKSSEIYARLLRGEATSREYVDQLRREARKTVRETRRRHRAKVAAECGLDAWVREKRFRGERIVTAPSAVGLPLQVGQVWEDTHVSNEKAGRWLFRIMKLNAKSVRVEPCEDDGPDGWNPPLDSGWQYRMEHRHFLNGRCRIVWTGTTP